MDNHPLLEKALAEFDRHVDWIEECMSKGKWPPGLGTGDPESYRLAWRQARNMLSREALYELQERHRLQERLPRAF